MVNGQVGDRAGPLLLAATRVTGAEPHLGTFYGWLRPVAEAARHMRVCVLIADLQSVDLPRSRPINQETGDLETALRAFLPPSIPIVRESNIPSLASLAFLTAPLFAAHHLRRIAPLRRLADAGQPIPISTMLYPAMMIADVLAFGTTHVLAKPEGRFQHSDVLNDVLARAARRYRWPSVKLELHPKPKINIPSADGTGPMKRDRPGYLPIRSATPDDIAQWTAALTVPGHLQPGQHRLRSCRVAWPIWQSISAGQPPSSARAAHIDAIREGCTTHTLSCPDCTAALSQTISDDLTTARTSPDGQRRVCAKDVTDEAEDTAQKLVRLAVG